MNNKNNYSARDAYDIAREILYNGMRSDPAFNKPGQPTTKGDNDCWDWVNSRKLSQNEVRMEVKLNATNNQFKFGLTQNQPNTNNVQFVTEHRLDMQDIMVMNEMKFEIGLPASDTDVNWEPVTYPNTQIFAAGDVPLLKNILYGQGWFSMMVNNDNIIPYRRLKNWYQSNQTQQTAALGTGSPQDQECGAEDGIIVWEPNILLIGSKGYIPQINFPAAMTGLAGSVRAIITALGVLGQNASSVS